MDKVYEEEKYTVIVRRGCDQEFGEYVSEMWLRVTEDDKYQSRPFDRPSFTRYNPKTGEVLEQQWSLDDYDEIARKGDKPCYINRGKIRPHRLFGTHKDGNRRAEFPSDVKWDEKTGLPAKLTYDETSEVFHSAPSSQYIVPDTPEI